MLKKIAWLAIVILAACFLHACGDVQNSTNGKTVASLTVTPAKVACGVSSPEAFYAIPTYTDGTIGSYLHATWSVTNSLGSLLGVGFAEILTPSVAGTGEVHAVFGSLTGVATVTVTGSPTPEPNGLTTIEVSPATLDMPVGATQTFTATGVDSLGNSVAFTPAWSLIGSVGTFTFSGATATLEATSTGTAMISCASGEVVGTVPVTIEGQLVNLTVEVDTYVDQAQPTTTLEGGNTLTAGYNSAGNSYFETYLRFSLTSLPAGVTIESAILELYVNSADSSSLALELDNLNSPFTAATNWSTKPPDSSSSPIQSTTTFTAGQYNSINPTNGALLTDVMTWYSSPATNYGISIRQPGTNNGIVTFYSKENTSQFNPPILTVIDK